MFEERNEAGMKKPNILVIMSDEHDAAVTGCYGDPLVKTPHLDKLAEGCGTRVCEQCVPEYTGYSANTAWAPWR